MRGDLAATRQALCRAVEFLLTAHLIENIPGGAASHRGLNCWKEFNAFGTSSDEWVSAYAGCALARSGVTSAFEAACAVWEWLIAAPLHLRPGFGYNRKTPPDADSCVWGCRLAEAIGHASHPCALESFDLLKNCARPDGGIATFTAAMLEPLHVGTDEAIAGWTASHTCVTATAAWFPDLMENHKVEAFLARTQCPDGFWKAYWWGEPEYATAHAVESLTRAGMGSELVERAVTWLSESPRPRSPFALALRVLGISSAGSRNFLPALQQLLALQLADGSWPASTRLRIPPPQLPNASIIWNWDEQHNGIGSILPDTNRIFTTASALRALTSCLTQ